MNASPPTKAVLRQMAEAVIRLTCGPTHLYGQQLDAIASNTAAMLEEQQRMARQPNEPSELEQLRRIDRAARAYVEWKGSPLEGKAWDSLNDALFNGLPETKAGSES